MDSTNKENNTKESNVIVDVEYCNLVGENEPIYATKDVAEMLNKTESCIRYWSDRFEECIDKNKKNIYGFEVARDAKNNRLFNSENIAFLRTVRNMNDGGMSLAKIKEILLQENEMDKKELVHQNFEQLTNALTQSIMQGISTQLETHLEKQKNEILKEIALSSNTIDNNIQNTLKNHSENISDTLERFEGNMSTQVEDALKTQINDFKQYMDKQELEFKEKDEKTIEFFREQMQKKEDKNKELEEEKNNKGFFNKLFGR